MVEVLIALAITSFALVLASFIYLRLQKSSKPFFKVKAVELAETYMGKAWKDVALMDETYTHEEFTIKRSVRTHPVFVDCQTVRVVVFDLNKTAVFELESLMYKGK